MKIRIIGVAIIALLLLIGSYQIGRRGGQRVGYAEGYTAGQLVPLNVISSSIDSNGLPLEVADADQVVIMRYRDKLPREARKKGLTVLRLRETEQGLFEKLP